MLDRNETLRMMAALDARIDTGEANRRMLERWIVEATEPEAGPMRGAKAIFDRTLAAQRVHRTWLVDRLRRYQRDGELLAPTDTATSLAAIAAAASTDPAPR